MATIPLVVEPVTMIAELGSAIVVEHQGRRSLVPRELVLAGTDLVKPGDCGRIVVPLDLAYDLALLPTPPGRGEPE